MTLSQEGLAALIGANIRHIVAGAETTTRYREPLVGFVSADDPRFLELRRLAGPAHQLPQDLLPGARAVVSFFLPFASDIVEANSRHKEQVAREWAVAYVETSALIGRITAQLIETLAALGVRAAAEPATHNFDPVTLESRWSHKSVAVMAGLGSFGLHQMVITDSGCAGRFGSLILDAELTGNPLPSKERCLYFHDGSCLECVQRCPVNALDANVPLDKQRCWAHLLEMAPRHQDLGVVDACGKCALGPCSLESTVH
jgi:epoxyqueuosine reductase QueG